MAQYAGGLQGVTGIFPRGLYRMAISLFLLHGKYQPGNDCRSRQALFRPVQGGGT